MGLFSPPAAPPTPEQIAYREAQKAANRRVRFFGHLVAYAATNFFLLIVAGWEAFITVATAWGIGVAIQGFYAIMAPSLRKRWMDEEVQGTLLASVSTERKMLQDRHARSIEELSASIAHEIRNPITAAKSLVQQIGEDPSSKENSDYAKIAIEELDRVERSISHLLRYAREEGVRFEEVRIAEVVDSALETFRDRIQKSGVEIGLDLEAAVPLRADPEKLRRVVINLVGNAIDELEAAKRSNPRIHIAAGRNLAGTELWLEVRDNGPGIEPDRIQKIWSPFYTSKETGTGLGLAISKKLVEAHGGSIEVQSDLGVGTKFILTFPLSQRSEEHA
jgi:signal transduction histidine kinase